MLGPCDFPLRRSANAGVGYHIVRARKKLHTAVNPLKAIGARRPLRPYERWRKQSRWMAKKGILWSQAGGADGFRDPRNGIRTETLRLEE
jgi:hypothetical protein